MTKCGHLCIRQFVQEEVLLGSCGELHAPGGLSAPFQCMHSDGPNKSEATVPHDALL